MFYKKWACSFLCLFASLQASDVADYIVIGLGTSGAVLAKQLTDDNVTSVIALHNGKNLQNDPDIKFTENVLFTVASILLDSPFYESGSTTKQPFANNRKMPWGIALPEGGASSINAGAWCWNTPQVSDQWEALAGPNWSSVRIDAIYKSLETYNGETTNPPARGSSGPLNVRQIPQPDVTPLSRKFVQAITSATGFAPVLDYNDPLTPIGPSDLVQYTQTGNDGKIRVSSATAFLNPSIVNSSGKGVNGRKLNIKFNTMAMRTIWKGNKAVGVEYWDNGKIKKAYANKGVIVCGGLRSSVFLMQSGVGPKSQLESLGIPVIFDNPNVGQGLTDQPHVIIGFLTNPDDTPDAAACGGGSFPNGISVSGSNASLPITIPDLSDPSVKNQFLNAIFCNGYGFPSNSPFAQISWLPDPTGDQSVRQVRISTISPFPGFAVCIVDLDQSQSRGSVSINSINPFDPPIINPGELNNSMDLSLYVLAFQIYVKNIADALESIDPKYKLIFPDPAILTGEDSELIAFIQDQVGPNQHWQSHCRMAPLDQGGVVDGNGRVYGVQNLIVADNSINPVGTDGSPMASGYMVAANIAQILLQQ